MSTKGVVQAIVGVAVIGVVLGIPVYRFLTRTPPVTGADRLAQQALIDREHDAAPPEIVAALTRLHPRLREIGAIVESGAEGEPCGSERSSEPIDTPLITRALIRATLNPAPVEGSDSYWHPERPQAAYEAPVKISETPFRSLSEYFRVSAEFEGRPSGSNRRA